MQELRQSTQVKVRVGCFVDITDGVTPQTDITLGGDAAELLKHNGAATVDISAATWAAVTGGLGWYDLTLTTGHTDTLGMLTVVVQDISDCRQVSRDFMVVTQNFWDSKYSTDKLQVHVAEVTAGIIANASLNADVGSTAYGTNVIAIAVRKVLDELNLDHLMKVGVANRDTLAEIVDDTVLANLMTKTDGDTSDFDHATDSLEAVKDEVSAAVSVLADVVNDTDVIDDGTSGLVKIAQDVAAILVDTGTAGVVLKAAGLDADAVTEIWSKPMVDIGAGAPSATATALVALNYLYEVLRNKTETTATEIAIYKDNGSTKLMESTISDNGTTFSKGEYRAEN